MPGESPSRQQQRPKFCKMFSSFLKRILIFIHGLFDAVVDYLFSLYYNDAMRKQLPPVHKPFLMDSAVTLARKIRNRELKSEEVVEAYIERIKQVNKILNAVVDNRFNAALQEAREADKLIESGEWSSEDLLKARPFHGVPFTNKVSTCVKDMRHTIGIVARRNTIATEDAEVVVLIRKVGGIPIALTNVPELCMWYETRCNVHGQTNNPYDTNRMVGGSSGGESSIIAACGTAFGIGTDIGGSLRMPAFFCGIFAHKPTTGLTPLRGLGRRTGVETGSMACAGPMSRYAEDLSPILAALVSTSKPSLNLASKVDIKNIKVYFMDDDMGDIRVSPVCKDLRTEMYKALCYLREVTDNAPTELHIADMKYGYKLWRYLMTKEPEKVAHELTNREGYAVWWIELIRMLCGQSDYTMPSVMRLIDQLLPQENPQWAEAKLKKLLDTFQHELGDNGVLIYPSHPYPALYHYVALLRPWNFAHTAVFNALNFPATQVPLGLNKDGLPLGIQVVSTPYNDRLCLAVAEELQRAFGGWVPPFKTS